MNVIDSIWMWPGWHIIKWIFGILLATFIVIQIWYLEFQVSYAKEISSEIVCTLKRIKNMEELKQFITEINFLEQSKKVDNENFN